MGLAGGLSWFVVTLQVMAVRGNGDQRGLGRFDIVTKKC
jgi:hypothetical protein